MLTHHRSVPAGAAALALLVAIPRGLSAQSRPAAPVAAGETIVRPFATVGALVLTPSASGLGYQCINCSVSAWNLSYSRVNAGAGVQVLFHPRPLGTGAWNIRWGAELGWQTEFSEKGFLPGDPPGSYTTNDMSAVHLLALAQFTPAKGKVFLQAGAGLYFCTLKYRGYVGYTQNQWGNYGATAVGLLAGAGMNLISTPSFTMPVIARLSYLAKYGSTLTADVLIGADFKMR